MELRFDVTGMTCAACSARVEKVTKRISGITKVEVNLLAGKMLVETDRESAANDIILAVQQAGYHASISGEKMTYSSHKEDALKEMKIRIIGSAVCLVVLMYFTMGHMFGLPMPSWYHGVQNAIVATLLQLFLTLPVVYLNRNYYSKGIKALFHRSPNMDTLIAVGSGAALIYGVIALFRMAYAMGHGQLEIVQSYSENLYFESAAMILTLITLGKYLETRAKGRTGDAIAALIDLSPKMATVRRNNQEYTIPTEDVVVGDVVIVRSGSTIAVDGVIISGHAAIDQSALTGESVPVEKNEGDSVAAATICREGYLEICVNKIGEDTTLSQIIRLVEQAGGSKAPIARLADKIAGIFVPVVMAISAVAFVAWMIAGESVEFALNIAISVLVISCPCALGLATPVAIMVGIGKGAGMGILFKNAEVLENLHSVDTVVFDKTGTLTKGVPVVTDILPHNIAANNLLLMASSLELRSEHPFAKAIVANAGDIDHIEVAEFHVHPGRGVSGVIGGEKVYGGSAKFMEMIGVEVPAYDHLTNMGKTPLFFATENRYLGMIAVADVLKKDAEEAIKLLKEQKLQVVMLTGDNKKTATAIAKSAGVDNVISDVLPADKVGAIRNLQNQGHKVLMIGDGINDAPALVSADVGMAIGTGTDIAMESAGVVLMNQALSAVAHAICLSKATIRNIKQNLFWAFFYNCLGIPVAAGVLYPFLGIQLSPMLGAAAMSMSSVFVVTNALRLRYFKPKVSVKETVTMETVIGVEGMMCSHCKARVESVCKGVAGVEDAIVDLQAKTVTIKGNAEIAVIRKAIVEAGYELID